MTNKTNVEQAFNRYVSAYNAADPKIRLKIDHTCRVAALCERIASSVGLEDTSLAWLCGMLHDIGRFEQVKRYGTFVDAVSVDHAALGADLLFREGLASAIGCRVTGIDYSQKLIDIAKENRRAAALGDWVTLSCCRAEKI